MGPLLAIMSLSLALGAAAISAGSFGCRGVAKSTVYTPLCNPSPFNHHHILRLLYSVAHSLPPRTGPPPPSKRRPCPHPAPDLTTTSCNSHLISPVPTDNPSSGPRRKSIQVLGCLSVGDICGRQGWRPDGKPVECQGTRGGEGSK